MTTRYRLGVLTSLRQNLWKLPLKEILLNDFEVIPYLRIKDVQIKIEGEKCGGYRKSR